MRSFSYTYFYLAIPQCFCFFHFVRITEITQTNILNALGIPHSFQLFHFLSNPFISLYFKHFQAISALRFASALANVNEENEGEKEKARRKKVWAENEEKRSTLREKENTGNCPFENIGFYLVILFIYSDSISCNGYS